LWWMKIFTRWIVTIAFTLFEEKKKKRFFFYFVAVHIFEKLIIKLSCVHHDNRRRRKKKSSMHTDPFDGDELLLLICKISSDVK